MAEHNSELKADCEDAFLALKSYAAGSARAVLLPLDKAVAAAGPGTAQARRLEAQLVAALNAGGSAEAQEYICSKLALIGSKSCVGALARLLAEPRLATAARNALERIPGSAPSAALRKAFTKGDERTKAGIVQSLGVRRDAASVGLLSALLKNNDGQLIAAAAGALGEIGSVKAAGALSEFFRAAPAPLKRNTADALLRCAERLRDQGHQAEARALLNLVVAAGLPRHITQAAEQGLQRLS